MEHSYYKNGKLDGEYKKWYSDGKLMEHYIEVFNRSTN